jgi:hypothetical protein
MKYIIDLGCQIYVGSCDYGKPITYTRNRYKNVRNDLGTYTKKAEGDYAKRFATIREADAVLAKIDKAIYPLASVEFSAPSRDNSVAAKASGEFRREMTQLGWESLSLYVPAELKQQLKKDLIAAYTAKGFTLPKINRFTRNAKI